MLIFQEEYESRQKTRDPYDVRWLVRPNEKEIFPWEVNDVIEDNELQRSDAQIISFALRKRPKITYFTNDLKIKEQLVEDLKRGKQYFCSILYSKPASMQILR